MLTNFTKPNSNLVLRLETLATTQAVHYCGVGGELKLGLFDVHGCTVADVLVNSSTLSVRGGC